MKHPAFRVLAARALLTLAALAPAAYAGPIVANGSTYDSRFFSLGTPVTSLAPIVFDGIAQSFSALVGGVSRQITVNESDTDLGGGNHRITIDITSDGNLAAAPSLLASAGNVDAIDLLGTVQLTQALLTITTTLAPQTFNIPLSSIVSPNPWNGRVPGPGNGTGSTLSSTDADVRGYRFDFFVSQIPEPGSLALVLAAALPLLAAARRRR